MGVGGIGVDDLEDPAAEDPEVLGVVVLGELDEVLLAPCAQVGLVGKGVDGGADHAGLFGVDVAGGHRVAHGVVVGERRGESGVAARGESVLRAPWPARPSRRRRRGRRRG